MEALEQILVFGAQALIIVLSLVAVIIAIAFAVFKNSNSSELEIERLDEKIKARQWRLWGELKDPKELKKQMKLEHKEEKKFQEKPVTYVIDFRGDMKANAVDQFREEISTIILGSKAGDEVLIKLESPGGVVHGYGLAAAQMIRLKNAGLKVTACVDKVAASGGYMMACTAHRIVCAPFAIVGSIGVVAQVPNLNRLLKKWDVDYKEYTAGDYKRTISFLGEITPKGETKFLEQLESTHLLFKNFVSTHRPQVSLEKVATGEHWYGTEAKDLGLIDDIATSDDLILEHAKTRRVLKIKYEKKQKMSDKLTGILGKSFYTALQKTLEDLQQSRWI